MNTHIQVVKDNNWIYDCVGPWDYRLLLATKSYQEGCIDIKDFIWRLCVSYRSLNSVTRSFKFTIPRCTDIIEDFSDSSVFSFNDRSGYHPTRVLNSNQEKYHLLHHLVKENFQGDILRSKTFFLYSTL